MCIDLYTLRHLTGSRCFAAASVSAQFACSQTHVGDHLLDAVVDRALVGADVDLGLGRGLVGR